MHFIRKKKTIIRERQHIRVVKKRRHLIFFAVEMWIHVSDKDPNIEKIN